MVGMVPETEPCDASVDDGNVMDGKNVYIATEPFAQPAQVVCMNRVSSGQGFENDCEVLMRLCEGLLDQEVFEAVNGCVG